MGSQLPWSPISQIKRAEKGIRAENSRTKHWNTFTQNVNSQVLTWNKRMLKLGSAISNEQNPYLTDKNDIITNLKALWA